MKKSITLGLAAILLLSSLSFSFAGDEADGHLCFKRVDANHDDIVTFQEFKTFYGDNPEKFQEMDQDNDEKLTHDEYEEYLYNQEE